MRTLRSCSASIALVVTLVAAIASCRADRSESVASRDREKAVADTARVVAQAALDAVAARDTAALMRLFAHDPQTTFSGDGAVFAGHDSIGSMLRAVVGGWRAVDSASVTDVRAQALGDNAAVATTRYRELITDTTGRRFWNQGVLTVTVVRRPEGWRIVDAHASHPPAPR